MVLGLVAALAATVAAPAEAGNLPPRSCDAASLKRNWERLERQAEKTLARSLRESYRKQTHRKRIPSQVEALVRRDARAEARRYVKTLRASIGRACRPTYAGLPSLL